jgi:hypothetical protein
MNSLFTSRAAFAALLAASLLAACGDDPVETNNNADVDMAADMADMADMNTQNDMPTTTAVCGDGQVGAGETCDGADCPTSCPAAACVTSTLVGGAATCDARCETAPITACQSADGCCPAGCTVDQDSDCTPAPMCGNGVKDAGETCDGADCPTALSCGDNDACTADSLVGNPAMCDAACLNEPIVICADGDGCCQPSCMGMDSDCAAVPTGDTGSVCVDDADCGASQDALCITDPGFVGGYCTTLFCQSDADCGGDALCLAVDQQGTTACFDGCIADADCRTGYICEDIGGVGICFPPESGPSLTVGDSCVDDTDCGPTQDDFCITDPDFVDGYCVSLNCQSDADCGGDALCLTVDQQGTTACFDGCAADADCRTSYTCQDVSGGQGFNICLPPPAPLVANTNEPCIDDTDCSAGTANGTAFCLTQDASNWPGGSCSSDCQADSDCGVSGICQDNACVLGCAADADCRAGYTCQDFFGAGVSVCAPAAGSTPGAACAQDTDCVAGIGGRICQADLPGGYCVAGCQTDAGCPAGSVCEQGACLDSCATNTDCRADYECYNAFGSTRPVCGPVANGAGVVGSACTAIADCAGGQRGTCLNDDQWTGGYCLVTGCDAQNPCAAGSHCGFIDQATNKGSCVADCTVDTDCRGAGYACSNGDMAGASECLPSATGTGAVGAACAALTDCAGGQLGFCFTEATQPDFLGGYCSIDCTDSGMCPAGAACLTVGQQGERVCLDSCTSDAQCRNGYSCQLFGNDQICLPF